MALANRTLLTPEWAFWHRNSVAGSMMCRVSLTSVSGRYNTAWTPKDGFSNVKPVDELEVYRGIARVQPNKDWRARKQKFETEAVTEHAYRIQLAFDGQELEDNDGNPLPFPAIHAEDRVRVIQVQSLRGIEVDPAIKDLVYIVRNSVAGSNYWVRTLLCDVIL